MKANASDEGVRWSSRLPSIAEACVQGTMLAEGQDFHLFLVTLPDDDRVVIKAATPRQSEKSEVRELLRTHHQQLSRIVSRHVVQPFPLLPLWGERIGFAMPFYPGGTLAKFIEQHQLSVLMRDDFVRQIAQGLLAIRDGIGAHQDLHLSNVLVEPDATEPTGFRLLLIDPFPTQHRPQHGFIDDLHALDLADRLLHRP
jgi:serine/threonine protein kinase